MSWLPTKGGIPVKIVEDLAGSSGRWAKAVVGPLLMTLGVVPGGGRGVLAVIVLAPLRAGTFAFRQHGPRVRSRRGAGCPDHAAAAMNTLSVTRRDETVGYVRGRRRAMMATPLPGAR
ncbi:MAG: hypothetical protein ACXVGQ_10770 [Mycobacteriaceae bacterium]